MLQMMIPTGNTSKRLHASYRKLGHRLFLEIPRIFQFVGWNWPWLYVNRRKWGYRIDLLFPINPKPCPFHESLKRRIFFRELVKVVRVKIEQVVLTRVVAASNNGRICPNLVHDEEDIAINAIISFQYGIVSDTTIDAGC